MSTQKLLTEKKAGPGRPGLPPEKKKLRVLIPFEPADVERIRIAADADGRSMAAFLRHIILVYLATSGRKK